MAHATAAVLKEVHVDTWKSFDVEELITLAACTKNIYPRNQPKLNDIPLILHSSGTTGLPKPILLSNRWLIYILALYPRKTEASGELIMDYGETIMTTFCAFHLSGVLSYWLPLTMGGSAVLLRSEASSTAEFLALIRKRMVTFAVMMPVHLENLASILQSEGIDQVTSDGLRNIKVCVYRGAPMADGVGDFLQSSGLNVANRYGSTELNAVAVSSFSSGDKNYHLVKPHEFSSGYVKWEPYDKDLYHLLVRGDCPTISPTAAASINASGYYETNNLFQKDPSGYWRYIRRIDDTLVL
ncbi:hypothetical protein BJV82DRAFT_336352 [Fennellomyces sp. T-0311]|nr:hypothetical protein BJV82DRAFT_336352 [Fennellomyces sp. T-0311]